MHIIDLVSEYAYVLMFANYRNKQINKRKFQKELLQMIEVNDQEALEQLRSHMNTNSVQFDTLILRDGRIKNAGCPCNGGDYKLKGGNV